ncbi:electron transport complex subunit E [Anaerococcus sp. NML200574]|mgnify:CR=1 FL=1|uniref:Ion-translocating oxidoreductase complex subunit E n=1 Tax=Anaerococcus kampingae TaxID=3115614 RepID=A0ABW9MEN7_9FIRM|nr:MULTISPECIES: electron transport complex subunit E [unclassified Anaerococcus]MCW6678217.1 electron transport complex subunit E [Anaerococcus sp. NML200574]MCW6701658.1 electron transport complex subunit E [Anaerococcus sp. NML200537]
MAKENKKEKVNFGKIFTDGIIKNNPVLVQMVGMCSVLAISSTLTNAVGMGVSVTFVLVMSNLVISLLRNFISDEIRIPSFIVVIAGFVTIVQMLIKAYAPALDQSLGIFIPLIVVNCIILARAEGFASQNGPIASIVDGISQGIGYTIAISILAFFRELLGAGTLFGIGIIPEEYTIGFMLQPASSFIVLGMIYAAFHAITNRKKAK